MKAIYEDLSVLCFWLGLNGLATWFWVAMQTPATQRILRDGN